MTEENGTTSEQPAQQGHINISVSPAGMVLTITPAPFNLVIDENGMQQMVVQWLAAHPDVFDEIVKSRLTQKKAELTLIKTIKDSRLN